ncbi:MAG: winged helix-turn-helix domain-containing tetratricopeptide repeat protein [Blastocatellia bacterium]
MPIIISGADSYHDFGPFRLLPAARVLLREGQPVALTAKVFDLLVVLVENRGVLLERNFLMNMLWPDAIVEEGNLTQCIFVLRKALGAGHSETTYIATVPGRGYRFVAPVTESTGRVDAPGLPQINDGQQAISLTTSLAVLPLKLLGVGQTAILLGTGVADAIISSLSRNSRLIVRPTTAVLKYAEIGKDPIVAGRELRVDLVLDGTLQHAGERIRVSMQLVKVTSGVTLWADRFDATFTDVFAVQDSIAAQVAEALRLRIGIAGGRRGEGRTDDIEVYQLYIKGRYFWDKRSEPGLTRGLECAREMIRLDPNFASAWVGLADSCALLAEYLFRDPQAMFKEVKSAALKALELDDDLAEAHASLAEALLYHDWDWAEAEREYRLAIKLNPNYSSAFLFYAWLLLTQGRFDEASQSLRRAQRIDPGSLTLKTVMGLPHYYQRQYERAIGHYRQALEMEADFAQAHYYLGEALILEGRYNDAVAAFRHVAPVHPQQALALEAFAHARAGREDEARRILQDLTELAAERYISPYCLARIHAGLRDFEKAFAELERGVAERACWMIFLRVDPFLDELRNDPRFPGLLRLLSP